MAARTSLAPDEARAIAEAYGLSLVELEPLPGKGTVNSNFRLRARSGEFFLRVNEGKTPDDARAEARLVRALGEHGVPTPQPLESRLGELVHAHAGKLVTLFPWLPGREAQPDPRVPSTVAVAGEALGRIHAAGVEVELPRNHYTLDELERRLATFAGDARFAAVVPSLARELTEARRRARGPVGLIHQDLFPDNLLLDDAGGLAEILDFEQATRGPLVYDLAVVVSSWCWDGAAFCRTCIDAVLAAYAVTPAAPGRLASADERTRLLAAEARLAAARFTITRITDVFLPDGVDEDLRRRKDWRDYARRLDWWLAAA